MQEKPYALQGRQIKPKNSETQWVVAQRHPPLDKGKRQLHSCAENPTRSEAVRKSKKAGEVNGLDQKATIIRPGEAATALNVSALQE
jgi:hypothetical protein